MSLQLDRLKQAASASYTYLLANPDDVDTRHNIGYYRDKASIEDTDFVDLELVPYKVSETCIPIVVIKRVFVY